MKQNIVVKEDIWEPGKRILNDYIIVKSLGRGGAGQVFLVKRISTGQLFAIKTILSRHIDEIKRKQNFLRELRIWLELPEHPHIVSCRFFRTVMDRLVIFAEYVNGGSLKDCIRAKKLLKIEDILDVSIQIIWGLQVSEIWGVVHQDIKPANILLTRSGEAKITDFGLARALNTANISSITYSDVSSNLCTSSGMTPAYCSPEQASGEKLDIKTDMWSWALSVLEMFTGKVTWQLGVSGPSIIDE
ncbi:serine/threonine protein kinase, partial [bacterium]|nr:serine/threonine protein kinase [bacterium]